MAVQSIAHGVHQVGGRCVNSFIIDGDEGVILVDTLLLKEIGLVTRGLEEIGRSLDEVRAILITHSHVDHWGGAAAVKADSNAPVYAAEADAPVIRGADKPPVSPSPFYVKPLAWLIAALATAPQKSITSSRRPAEINFQDTFGPMILRDIHQDTHRISWTVMEVSCSSVTLPEQPKMEKWSVATSTVQHP